MYSGTEINKPRFDTVIVVGRRQTGKSVFGAELAAALGVKHVATSDFLIGAWAHHLTFIHGNEYEKWIWIIRKNKDHYRKELIWLADFATSVRGDTLIQSAVTSGARVICGVRRHNEVETRISRGHRDVWVKIVRPGAQDLADRFELDEIEKFLPPEIERHVVTNDGDLFALRAQARALANILKD